MDQLDDHCTSINCHYKELECVDDHGNQVMIVGVMKPIYFCMILIMQLKWGMEKGCQMISITMSGFSKSEYCEASLNDDPILSELIDYF